MTACWFLFLFSYLLVKFLFLALCISHGDLSNGQSEVFSHFCIGAALRDLKIVWILKGILCGGFCVCYILASLNLACYQSCTKEETGLTGKDNVNIFVSILICKNTLLNKNMCSVHITYLSLLCCVTFKIQTAWTLPTETLSLIHKHQTHTIYTQAVVTKSVTQQYFPTWNCSYSVCLYSIKTIIIVLLKNDYYYYYYILLVMIYSYSIHHKYKLVIIRIKQTL